MQTTNHQHPMGGDTSCGDGQIMANIAESMFSQHYQSDGLMMANTSSSSSSGGAMGGGIMGCISSNSISGGGMMDEMMVVGGGAPHSHVGRGRIFSIDLDRE